MSEEKDDRVDFEFVRDAIENKDQDKMKIVAKDFIRWMKASDEGSGMYKVMMAITGLSEEEVDEFIFEQVVNKAADEQAVIDAVEDGKAKEALLKKFQEDNQ